MKFAFCSASIVSRECSVGSIFAFSVEQNFSSVDCFPDNNLGLHFVYYRHLCLQFQSHVLLQAHWRMLHPYYRKVKWLSTLNHWLCCQWGCLQSQRSLKDGAFSNPTAKTAYLLSSGKPWCNRSLCMWLWIKTLFKCFHILPVAPEWQEQVPRSVLML